MRFSGVFVFLAIFSSPVLQAAPGVLDIDWASVPRTQARGVNVKDNAPAALTSKLNQVRVPVYLPSGYLDAPGWQVVADSYFYAASLQLDGTATMLVSGDANYQHDVAPGDFGITGNVGEALAVYNSEGVVSLDFQRHGINYSISIECASLSADERCKSDSLVRQVYAQLMLVGGAP